MNKILSTTLIVLAVLAVAGGVFFFGTVYARTNTYGPGTTFAPGAHMFWENAPLNAGGFRNNSNINNNYGPGMMGGRGSSGMRRVMPGGQRGYGMMSGYGQNNWGNSAVTTLTVDQVRQAAETYIQSLNVQGLEIGEVMIFDNNAYVAVKESGTGLGAFELLVDPASGIAYPEHGPNMMWNLKYGSLNHGGMMGGWVNQSTIPAAVSAEMSVTKDQAIKNAQTYLDQNLPGAIAADDPMQFYGYYTIDFSQDGKVAGMLSVNGYSGQIFPHTWHGTFLEEAR
jgi:hypothetical protein